MINEWLEIADSTLPESETRELFGLLWDAHVRASMMNEQNASNVAVIVSTAGSGSLAHALASAILATGGTHAPVIQARRVLFRGPVPETLDPDVIVPGFGNSFFRDRIDPSWDALATRLRDFPSVWGPIEAWRGKLADYGRAIHPNAAAFTAAVAELTGWPAGAEPMLVIQPRISVWSRVFLRSAVSRTMLS